MIGSRDNEDIFLPLPTHFQTHQNAANRWVTLGNTIRDLENMPGECAEFSESRLKYLKMVPEGGNWKSLPPEVLKDAMGGAYASGGGKVGFIGDCPIRSLLLPLLQVLSKSHNDVPPYER